MKPRWIIAAALAGAAAMIGGALLVVREDPPDPHAYPGTKSGFSFADAQRQSAVAVPECARESARFYLGGFPDSTVFMDFTAPDECVAEFLTGAGVDGEEPLRWKPVFQDSKPPIIPPAESKIVWEFPRTDTVDYWMVERGAGVDAQAVLIVLNRSARPQHVYVRAFPSD